MNKALHHGSAAMDRRDFLRLATIGATAAGVPRVGLSSALSREKKSVTAIATVYRKNSHADVIVGKILEGWEQKGGPGPDLELASMYVDQFPDGDLSRTMSEQYGFPIYDTIEQAITLGKNRVAVDGVISIGEHGDYPWNDLGQHLYPRRRFFREIAAAMEKYGRSVPVFNDKHPGPVWEDAKWMYDRAIELNIPFMAGSSLPVSFRKPDFTLPMNSQLEGCLCVGYSGLDIYGFHTLEFLQCVIERRQTATQAVRWVQALPGSQIKSLIDSNIIRNDLLEMILRLTPRSDMDLLQADAQGFTVFLIQYVDGLLVPVLMLPGYARAISVVVKPNGAAPIGGIAEERHEPFPHFAYLLKGIEQMVHSGKPAYPVERTMLTAGMLDRLLTSKSSGGEKLATPELNFNYTAIDYPHAPHLQLTVSS